MKNNKTIFIIMFLLIGIYAQSQVLWYGDPDKSVTSSFRRFDSGNAGDDCSNQSNNASTVNTVTDSKYGKVWRIRKPIGQKRGEFARTTGSVNNYVPKEGDVLYYGWRWKIESSPNINNGIAVWQWKTDAGDQNNTQNYPLNMGYGNGKLSLNAWGPCYPSWSSCGGSISKRKTTLWNKSIPENTWVSFVVKVKLSRDKDLGYVEFWYNGEKQTLTNSEFQDYTVTLSSDKKRAYHKTFDGTVVYPKWGSYNANSCSFDVTTYYDEMKVAKDLESATPFGNTIGGNNEPPTVSLTNPSQNNQEFTLGETITLKANASDPDGDVDRVNFKVNGGYYNGDYSAPYSVTWKPTQPGTYTIGARAFEQGQEGLATEVTRTVIIKEEDNNNEPPTVSLTNPSQNNQEFTLGETITLKANASDSDGDVDVDRVNFKVNGSYYKTDRTAPYSVTWTPTEAGTYAVGAKAFEQGQEGLATEVTRTIIVKTNTTNTDNFCSFGTPANSGISAINKLSFSNVHILGNGGPNLSNVKELSINWNPQYNGLYQFAFNTNNATPAWYVDFKDIMSYQLKNTKPEVTLVNTGFPGLDGSYWVTMNKDDFVMVSKTKDFTIYFSNSSQAPSCIANKTLDNLKVLNNILLYPNPVNKSHVTIKGIRDNNTTIDIITIQGKVVHTVESKAATSVLIDVSALTNGLYIALIKDTSRTKSILFVKE